MLLVNAAPIKQVPGRKTDVADCVWIAQLLEHGLLRGSFVPAAPIRDLRDLTRHRKGVIQERQRAVNRVHKLLQDAGIKLASVAAEIAAPLEIDVRIHGTTHERPIDRFAQEQSVLPASLRARNGMLCPGKRPLRWRSR